jgi:hypothetical protein
MKSDLVDIKAKLIHETEKAYRFDFGLDAPIWIPKSMCEWDGNEVTMSESVAIEKGLDSLV